ncbi:MAG: hypothetical protein FJX76_21945 [Armatimonadetes bacterium]|nr:hypothetical protein [Armatimonadota bacterium]
MDSSRGISGGSSSWNANIAPLRTPAFTPGTQPGEVNNAPAVPGDAVSISGGIAAEVPADVGAAVTAEAPATSEARQRDAVPTTLLAEDVGSGLLGNVSSTGSDTVASLGVLAQLDEPTAVHSVRAIDGPSQPNAFADLNLVGPSNAQRYLANPNELYLGI